MASLSGVSSSNTVSSLMNSANMISGLASGLDTESMIENLVKSYSTKINQLNQKVTKVEWKQDAYRSIISKMVGFSNKYTSYTSSSNLTSPSFFNSAIKVDALGAFADKVSATGKTSSEISLDKVTQLATAAQYRTAGNMKTGDGRSIEADSALDLEGTSPLAKLNGSLTLTYGSKTVSIQFDQIKDVETIDEIKKKDSTLTDSEVLAKLIEQKLADEKIAFNSGKSESADKRIGVDGSGGSITFEELGNASNGLYISGASGNVAEVLGLDLENASEDKITSFDAPGQLVDDVANFRHLSNKTMSLTLDGTTRQITMPIIARDATGTGPYKLWDSEGNPLMVKNEDGTERQLEYNAKDYTTALNNAVQDAFKGKKITVSNVAEDSDKLQLRFDVQEGSELSINTSAGKTLGIGETASSYQNTNKTLKELLGNDLSKLTPAKKKDELGVEVLDVDEKTDKVQYEFKINGVLIGKYTEDAKLSDIMADINSNKEAGVTVAYSQTTKNYFFKSKETGIGSEINMGEGLAQAMFGSTEVSSQSGSFAESYGMTWLGEGEKEEVTFTLPGATSSSGYTTSFDISKDDTIEDVANRLNQTIKNLGYTASYNKYTGQLEVSDKSGAAVDLSIKDSDKFDITFDEEYAPGVSYTPGQDAKFTVTVNGETKEMTRSSNTVNIDGLSITMKDTFDGYKSVDGKENAITGAGRPANAITFQSRTDSDKIVDAIKGMIDEYNTMMSEIKSAYSTMPYQNSSGAFQTYEPLTDEDKEGMSESAIERYEEKAKQGILFGDRNLSALYDKMRNVFAGTNEAALRSMGITISYSVSDNAQAVTLDEEKLRAALESDPDKVAETFTGETGVMQTMKTTLDNYAKTTGEPKGILIQQAGSPLSALSLMNNSWQKEIDNINTQIEKWQDKLTSQVERYTSQFSRLEVLINQMNSQSSTLAGLMGGG